MSALLMTAERIAREAHAGQLEELTGNPYIIHVERVVALVEGEEMKAVAWLHDVIEDTRVSADEMRRAGIPASVVDAVVLLSHDDQTEPYAEYIERLRARQNPLALAVKIADLRDHVRPMEPPVLGASQIEKYESALRVLDG